MNKKSDPPVIDADILLLDAQETNICIIWNIIDSDARHQPAEKGQGQQ